MVFSFGVNFVTYSVLFLYKIAIKIKLSHSLTLTLKLKPSHSLSFILSGSTQSSTRFNPSPCSSYSTVTNLNNCTLVNVISMKAITFILSERTHDYNKLYLKD